MTNAEMYKKVFGLDPDIRSCPTFICTQCPLHDKKPRCDVNTETEWWDKEYKEPEK